MPHEVGALQAAREAARVPELLICRLGLQGYWAVATDNDTVQEPDSVVTATILPGRTYRVGSPSTATLTVTDND